MKKTIIAVIFIVGTLPLIYVQTRHFWKGDFMSLKKVCQRWGEHSLDIAKFKSANEDESIRARMSCSLLKNQKKYIGKDRSEIRNLFGAYSGYYFSGMFPTYLIEKAKTEDQDSWQIVFLINRKEKISKIVVHKNCCYH